jgi:Holliday junction resolvase RusA-like endonuclease
MIKFFIPCEPPRATAQGSSMILKARDGRMFIGKPSRSPAMKAKRELTVLMAPFRPSVPFSGPLRLEVHWTYPWLIKHRKADRELAWRPSETKPDCDNLCKILKDLMTDLRFWEDDSQVADLRIVKGYGDSPGIHILVCAIDHDFSAPPAERACQQTLPV